MGGTENSALDTTSHLRHAPAAWILRSLHSFFLVIGLLVFGILLGTLTASAVRAAANGNNDFATAVSGLNATSFPDKVAAVETLAALGDDRAIPVLEAMTEGSLYARREDGRIVIGSIGRDLTLTDGVTGESLGPASSRDLSRITVNNALRSTVSAALGRLQIGSSDPAKRLVAAETMAQDRSPQAQALLREALARDIDATQADVFAFAGARCDRIVAGVLRRIAAKRSP